MASSSTTDVVVRANDFEEDSDASDDKSADYVPEPVVSASPTGSEEPVAKKPKKEHYSVTRAKKQNDVNKLVDKLMRMKDRGADDAEFNKFVAGYLAPKSRSDLSKLLTSLTGPVGSYDKVSNSAETEFVTDTIALESSSQKRREYFDKIENASRSAITAEIESQKEDMTKFKAKLLKATCNVRVLKNKYDLKSNHSGSKTAHVPKEFSLSGGGTFNYYAYIRCADTDVHSLSPSGCCGNGSESGCLLKMFTDVGKMDTNAAVDMVQQLRQTHTALKNDEEIDVFVMQLFKSSVFQTPSSSSSSSSSVKKSFK
ncbi:hypothetical protein B484DRAFT_402902 [Ochromonadaceae sp. CCMP2298]|nr:hypothetical protein B484DRAFT_402902 [Ochromonadaceae sp. CCMP2298]